MECKIEFNPEEYVKNMSEKQMKAIIDKALVARYLEIFRKNDLAFMNILESTVEKLVGERLERIIKEGMIDNHGNRMSIVSMMYSILNENLRYQISRSLNQITEKIKIELNINGLPGDDI
jgi:hypothetical protein